MQARFDRLVRAIEKQIDTFFPHPDGSGFALRLRDGVPTVLGGAPPAVTVVVNEPRGLAALSTFDTTAIGEAYLTGAIDVEGEIQRVLALRDLFRDAHPLRYLYRFVRPIFFGQVRSDRAAIPEHYDTDPEFFLLFLDRRHRCYSQAVFAHDDEPLEDAMTRKLDYALEAIGVQPGDRVLDIGGGWGAFTQYAGQRGIRVTSLTISEPSRRFIADLVEREDLPCEVRMEHFFEHQPAEPYDAIVNLGVTEHLPNYRATLARYRALLRPGGKVYLDASASRSKHDVSTFFERHIFRGNGSTLCLHEYVTEVSRTPFELEAVHNDRHSYLLTTRGWARNLDQHRAEIEQRWGKAQYRRFQLYLWGCVDGFTRDVIQAYRLVLALR
jgi:cyclopropane-fatty-acyl-phospholipid synthase